ncbi:hypothetical protein DH2020_007485 [Rehmannia glutinosa]|uniref:Uncharacterized protein n=1 Tax=Rehmannia glutinosa TaxID=99300 RepID=A0ABR0TYR7_REHGL
MAHVVRPLIRWPWWRHPHSTISHLISLRASSTRAATNVPFFAFFSTSYRQVHFSSRALKLRGVNSLPTLTRATMNSLIAAKQRRAATRESARLDEPCAGVWSLPAFHLLKSNAFLDLEQEVFDALMLVKRLGRDVKEGKRRQFNYIGTKILIADDKEEVEEEIVEVDEEENKKSCDTVSNTFSSSLITSKFAGSVPTSSPLISVEKKQMRSKVLLLHWEKLGTPWKVHSTLEYQANLEGNGKPDAATLNARRSLTRFLRDLAKQLPAE